APAADASAEVLREVLVPEDLAVPHVHADQFAANAERIKPVAVHGWSAARALEATCLARWANAPGPELPAVVLVQGDYALVAVDRSHEKDAARGDRGRAEPLAHAGDLPCEGRSILGPLLQQAGLRADVGAVRAAPLRPIVIASMAGLRLGTRAGNREQRQN